MLKNKNFIIIKTIIEKRYIKDADDKINIATKKL